MQHTSGGNVTRRGLFKWTGAAGMMAVSAAVTSCVPRYSGPGTVLEGAGGALMLTPGFSARIIARGGEDVAGTGYKFPIFPDGAATFADPAVAGGWYLVCNHEVPGNGGVSSIRFAPDGTVVGAQGLLSGTSLNCAGGPTPWGTWLSCEEFDTGRVWECDPTGGAPSVARPAMGAFAHEAAAVAGDGRVYLTEDRPNGGLYRFTPRAPGDLSAGLLEIATGTAPGPVAWVPVPDPDASSALTRLQVPATMRFDGGEGIDTLGDLVWFTTKGDNRVWEYSITAGTVSLRYQGGGASELSGVDNLWVDNPSGALLVAEDGGDLQVVAIRPDNTTEVLVQAVGHGGSEITGPCFSPDGQRLYFSSQRGPVGLLGTAVGVTYEVTGPFDALLGRP